MFAIKNFTKFIRGLPPSLAFSTNPSKSFSAFRKIPPPITKKCLFGAGAALLGAGGYLLLNKNDVQNTVTQFLEIPNKAKCMPPPEPMEPGLPVAYKFIHPAPKNTVFLKNHSFQWSHTSWAIGVMNPNEINAITHEDWNSRARRMLGHEFGHVKVHHVLVTSAQEIENDVVFNEKQEASIKYDNLFWCPRRLPIVTFIWDDTARNYRVYIYQGYALIQFLRYERGKGFWYYPESIEFISDRMYPVEGNHSEADLIAADSYLLAVVERFDQDWEIWQKKAKYVY